jgi:hypothetical protein
VTKLGLILVAAGLLFGDDPNRTGTSYTAGIAADITRWTLRHLQLVGLSLLLAVLTGVPLGVRAARNDLVGRAILAMVGVIYPVPSLASTIAGAAGGARGGAVSRHRNANCDRRAAPLQLSRCRCYSTVSSGCWYHVGCGSVQPPIDLS